MYTSTYSQKWLMTTIYGMDEKDLKAWQLTIYIIQYEYSYKTAALFVWQVSLGVHGNIAHSYKHTVLSGMNHWPTMLANKLSGRHRKLQKNLHNVPKHTDDIKKHAQQVRHCWWCVCCNAAVPTTLASSCMFAHDTITNTSHRNIKNALWQDKPCAWNGGIFQE